MGRKAMLALALPIVLVALFCIFTAGKALRRLGY
jgi:hypothetical protein